MNVHTTSFVNDDAHLCCVHLAPCVISLSYDVKIYIFEKNLAGVNFSTYKYPPSQTRTHTRARTQCLRSQGPCPIQQTTRTSVNTAATHQL